MCKRERRCRSERRTEGRKEKEKKASDGINREEEWDSCGEE